VDDDLFKFTTTDLHELHLAVMASFEEAAVLAPSMNLDAVRAALARTGWDEPTNDATLQRSLTSLTEWGLLEATQDHSARYSTPEEFERKNLQWSLTRRGEAAIDGVLHAFESLGHAVGLQTAVLDAIGDDLAQLAELAEGPATSEADARLHIQLSQVERHLSALVVGIRQFNGHLQRLLREDATEDAVFSDVKRRTVGYLEEYVDGVERPQRRLAAAIERVESSGLATVLDRALGGANLAPMADGDPGPAWLAERRRRWQALRAWFSPNGAEPPLIAGLLDIARTAIVELLRVLERRWDSRRRTTSVANDFRALARWFATASGDAEAHELFGAAFGLWPSRHAGLQSIDGEERMPASPWTATEPVDVAPALRTTGSLAVRGLPRPVADPARVRAVRQRAQAEALASHDELRRGLATGGAVRLSQFSCLSSAAFRELLELLAAGLDAPVGGDGARRAVSMDGRVEVVLRDPRDDSTAALTTDEGVLHAPDLLVSICVDSGSSTVEDAHDAWEEAAGG
jgi:uncharacterized protein (TIGR02677 family)